MSNKTTSPDDLPTALRWRLWIDGCGGFLLLVADQFSVGRAVPAKVSLPTKMSSAVPDVDVGVHADWPRVAGIIRRQGSDYFWGAEVDERASTLIRDGQRLAVEGSADLTFSIPSPLSATAVLKLRPPHRFDQHVDAVVLVRRTLLIGPGRDCHLRHREASETVVLVHRADGWSAKVGLHAELKPVAMGRSETLGSVAMTLEVA